MLFLINPWGLQEGDQGQKHPMNYTYKGNDTTKEYYTTKKQDATKDSTDFFFEEMWTYTYQNHLLDKDDWGYEGQCSFYYDTKTGAFLFTRDDSYGPTDEMAVWVLALPNGDFWTYYIDAEGLATYEVDSLTKTIFPDPSQLKKEFSKLFKPLNKTQTFGSNTYGWTTYSGQAYRFTFEQGPQIELFLTPTQRNWAPLYYFNFREAEAKLPLYFPAQLDPAWLTLSEISTQLGKVVNYQLTSVSPTTYYLTLPFNP